MSPGAAAALLLVFGGALTGCGDARLSACQHLTGAIARGSGEVLRHPSSAKALRESIRNAASTTGALRLEDPRLSGPKAIYVAKMTRALDEISSDKPDGDPQVRAAIVAVNEATVYALDDVNLFCSTER